MLLKERKENSRQNRVSLLQMIRMKDLSDEFRWILCSAKYFLMVKGVKGQKKGKKSSNYFGEIAALYLNIQATFAFDFSLLNCIMLRYSWNFSKVSKRTWKPGEGISTWCMPDNLGQGNCLYARAENLRDVGYHDDTRCCTWTVTLRSYLNRKKRELQFNRTYRSPLCWS